LSSATGQEGGVGGGGVGRGRRWEVGPFVIVGSRCHRWRIGREERVAWQGFRVVTDGGYAANAKGAIAFLPLVETSIPILPLIF
jgi:hypothetical protein